VTAMAHSTELQWAGGSDVGRVRTNNEDNFLIRPGLCVVADGMGGHRGGEIASALACEAMERGYIDHTVDGLLHAIDTANAAVHAAGETQPEVIPFNNSGGKPRRRTVTLDKTRGKDIARLELRDAAGRPIRLGPRLARLPDASSGSVS